MKKETQLFSEAAKFLRYWSLVVSTNAGSGHPSSSLSAADLMAVLFAKFFRFDFSHLDYPGNDRLIFSKGHASPLYYSLFALAGAIPIFELSTYRKFKSRLEGHPTPRFPYTEASTGSLGQGLSVGLGLALAIKSLTGDAREGSQKELHRRVSERQGDLADRSTKFASALKLEIGTPERQDPTIPRVFVLLGDGEMAEGSVWEAAEIASYYSLNNLVAIVDVNRFGQSGKTMLGHDVGTYQKRFEAFGWETEIVDGHDFHEIEKAFSKMQKSKSQKPFAIIAKTLKGKGISILEDKEGWHGKPIPKDQLEKALKELGEVETKLQIIVGKPEFRIQNSRLNGGQAKFGIKNKKPPTTNHQPITYKLGEEIATRKAYGTALARLGEFYPEMVVLDGDVGNSTYGEIFRDKFPDRFFQMFIAEQNMVGAAGGFSKMGFAPFASTFAAFFTRAFDQIRMARISNANIKFCGSHAGVSIGEDGASQMGLEDISMFRSIVDSVVLYPADAVATEKLVEEMVKHKGISYLRSSRPATPVIYKNDEKFPIGGSKVHRVKRGVIPSEGKSDFPKSRDLSCKRCMIIAAGITLFEALKAQEILAHSNIETIVVDCYSIKPIDSDTIIKLSREFRTILTVEDHWYDGGLGDAVLNIFTPKNDVKIYKLAVSKMPMSGKPEELLDYEKISAKAIVEKIKIITKIQ